MNNNQPKPNLNYTEFKQSLRLAYPMIATEWVYAITGFISSWMAAQLGTQSLAAMAIVLSIYIFFLVIIAGFGAALSIVVSQNLGAKNSEGIRTAFVQGTLLLSVIAIFVTFLIWISPKYILLVTNLDTTVSTLMTDALRTYTWSIIPCAILILFEKFSIGIHKSKLVMWLTLSLVPIEILSNYAFVFGKFGFPRYGIAGFGYGCTVSFSTMALAFCIALFLSPSLRPYRLHLAFTKSNLRNIKYFKEIWCVGWPLASTWAIELGAITIFTLLMAKVSTKALAAYQIAKQYLMLAMASLFAIAETAAVRVGYFVGQIDRQAIKRTFRINLAIGCAAAGVFACIYRIFDLQLVMMDLKSSQCNPELIREALHALLAVDIMLIIEGFRITTLGALRGLKDTKTTMLSSIVGFFMCSLIAAYILGITLKYGSFGLWIGFLFGTAISGAIVIYRFYRLSSTIDLQKLAM